MSSSKPVFLKDLRIQDLKKLLRKRKAEVGGNKEKLQSRLRSVLRTNLNIEFRVEDPDSFDFRQELEELQASAVSGPSLVLPSPANERKRIGNYHYITYTYGTTK